MLLSSHLFYYIYIWSDTIICVEYHSGLHQRFRCKELYIEGNLCIYGVSRNPCLICCYEPIGKEM